MWLTVTSAKAQKPQKTKAWASPTSGRSRITFPCSTTSHRNRRMRGPSGGILKSGVLRDPRMVSTTRRTRCQVIASEHAISTNSAARSTHDASVISETNVSRGLAVARSGASLHEHGLAVPGFYFHDGLGLSEVARVVGCGHFAPLAGQQRKIVVFPENGQHLSSVRSFFHLQVHTERDGLPGVGQHYGGFVRLRFRRRLQLHLRQPVQRAVIGEGFGGRYVPVGFFPIERFRLRRKPVQVPAHRM